MTVFFRSHSPARRFSRPVLPLGILAVLIVLALSLNGNVHAQTPEPDSPEAVFSESEAQNIDRRLMCPVCPAQTIAQSQVEIAVQMRTIVREMLAEGEDREGIMDFFVERYGKDILAAPPKSGANLVAWLLPIGGVAAALVAVFFIIRSMTQRGPVPVTSRPLQDEGLAPYLRLIDRHLTTTAGGGTSNLPSPAVEFSGTDVPGGINPAEETDPPIPDERT